MKTRISLIFITILFMCIGCKNRNPKSDAKQVCDCYKEAMVLAKNAQLDKMKIKMQICTSLNVKKAFDYQDNSSESKEFKSLTLDCVNEINQDFNIK